MTCAISTITSYINPSITSYEISDSKIKNNMRIVFISDLHNHEFETDNSELVNHVKVQLPDLIILGGDMMNEDSVDSHVVTDLVKSLTEVAPVYYALGNHEYGYIEADASNLISELETAGAHILDHNIYDIEINGNKLRLGGLYEYGFETTMQTPEENQQALSYLKQFADTDRYTIICPHRPESLYCWDWLDKWGIDLQLSGHLHGGQVIIPFAGGLYSDLEGFFPNHDYGEYKIGDSTMIITRGLSSNLKILPRFNNPPEIVAVNIVEKEGDKYEK